MNKQIYSQNGKNNLKLKITVYLRACIYESMLSSAQILISKWTYIICIQYINEYEL